MAQVKEFESKNSEFKELPREFIEMATKPSNNICCNCNNNLIKDPGFNNVTNSSGTSNISSTSNPWKPSDGTPQSSNAMGACDNGFISMWGNEVVGETIFQNGLTIPAGTYTVRFNAKYLSTPGAHNPYVKLRIGNGPIRTSPVLVTSGNINAASWTCYTMTFTTLSAISTLCLYPVNDNTQNNGSYVSWIQLDNICIERKQDCCDIPQNPPIKPNVSGLFCACDPIKFTTINCPGATYVWTVTDNFGNAISFTGNGTDAISLNYSLAQQIASNATGFVVTVKITCGGTTYTNTIKPGLKPIPKTNVSFSLTDDGSGNYTATATSLAPGNGNGWTLKEVNCPGPIPCSWVAGPIKWQSTGTTINIPNGVLVKGKCYVLTHYVNVCSPNWISGPCTVYKATCFKLDGNNMRMMSRETDKNDAQLILTEMLTEMNGIDKADTKMNKELQRGDFRN